MPAWREAFGSLTGGRPTRWGEVTPPGRRRGPARAPDHGAMPEDLDERLRRLRASDDAGALIDLGCDLADAGRHARRRVVLPPCHRAGRAPPARSTSATRWPPSRRWDGASPPTSSPWPGATPPPGATSAWCSRSCGDLAGAMRRLPRARPRPATRGRGDRRLPALVHDASTRAGGRACGPGDHLPAARADLGRPAARDRPPGRGPLGARARRQARRGGVLAAAGQPLRRRAGRRRGRGGGLPRGHRTPATPTATTTSGCCSPTAATSTAPSSSSGSAPARRRPGRRSPTRRWAEALAEAAARGRGTPPAPVTPGRAVNSFPASGCAARCRLVQPLGRGADHQQVPARARRTRSWTTLRHRQLDDREQLAVRRPAAHLPAAPQRRPEAALVVDGQPVGHAVLVGEVEQHPLPRERAGAQVVVEGHTSPGPESAR